MEGDSNLELLEVGIGADWFGRRRRLFSIGAGGTLKSSGGSISKGSGPV